MDDIDKRIATWQSLYRTVEHTQLEVRLAVDAKDHEQADERREHFLELARESARALADVLQAMGACRSR